MKHIVHVLLLMPFLLVSCTNKTIVQDLHPLRDRIIERDLSHELHGNVINRNVNNPVKMASYKDEKVAKYTIYFENESSVYDRELPSSLLEAIKSRRYREVVIVGHSHGWSKVGQSSLATRRADAVFTNLVKNGVDPSILKRIASWDANAKDGLPSRAVVLHMLKDGQIYAL
jgi:hypothetical protein